MKDCDCKKRRPKLILFRRRLSVCRSQINQFIVWLKSLVFNFVSSFEQVYKFVCVCCVFVCVSACICQKKEKFANVSHCYDNHFYSGCVSNSKTNLEQKDLVSQPNRKRKRKKVCTIEWTRPCSRFFFLRSVEKKMYIFMLIFCLKKKAADTLACTEGLRSILTAVCSIENGIVDKREISTWCVRMEWCVQKLYNCSKAIVIILFPIFNLSMICVQFKKFFVCPSSYSARVSVPAYWIRCWYFNKVATEKSKRRLQEIQFGLHTNEKKKILENIIRLSQHRFNTFENQ